MQDHTRYFSESYYASPVGTLHLTASEKAVLSIRFVDGAAKRGSVSNLLEKTMEQLEGYFAGRLEKFTVPIYLEGTTFQKAVWRALISIPYGQTVSYQEIAEKIAVPKAARAVGNAVNRNPLPIIIPCHRVIGANGTLVGFAGGLDVKSKLLACEGLSIAA